MKDWEPGSIAGPTALWVTAGTASPDEASFIMAAHIPASDAILRGVALRFDDRSEPNPMSEARPMEGSLNLSTLGGGQLIPQCVAAGNELAAVGTAPGRIALCTLRTAQKVLGWMTMSEASQPIGNLRVPPTEESATTTVGCLAFSSERAAASSAAPSILMAACGSHLARFDVAQSRETGTSSRRGLPTSIETLRAFGDSPDHTLAGGGDGTVQLFDARGDLKRPAVLMQAAAASRPAPITALADGPIMPAVIACGARDGTIHIVDTRWPREPVANFSTYCGVPLDLAWLPHQPNLLALVGTTRQLRIWSLNDSAAASCVASVSLREQPVCLLATSQYQHQRVLVLQRDASVTGITLRPPYVEGALGPSQPGGWSGGTGLSSVLTAKDVDLRSLAADKRRASWRRSATDAAACVAGLASRLIAAGRTEDAGLVLEQARPVDTSPFPDTVLSEDPFVSRGEAVAALFTTVGAATERIPSCLVRLSQRPALPASSTLREALTVQSSQQALLTRLASDVALARALEMRIVADIRRRLPDIEAAALRNNIEPAVAAKVVRVLLDEAPEEAANLVMHVICPADTTKLRKISAVPRAIALEYCAPLVFDSPTDGGGDEDGSGGGAAGAMLSAAAEEAKSQAIEQLFGQPEVARAVISATVELNRLRPSVDSSVVLAVFSRLQETLKKTECELDAASAMLSRDAVMRYLTALHDSRNYAVFLCTSTALAVTYDGFPIVDAIVRGRDAAVAALDAACATVTSEALQCVESLRQHEASNRTAVTRLASRHNTQRSEDGAISADAVQLVLTRLHTVLFTVLRAASETQHVMFQASQPSPMLRSVVHRLKARLEALLAAWAALIVQTLEDPSSPFAAVAITATEELGTEVQDLRDQVSSALRDETDAELSDVSSQPDASNDAPGGRGGLSLDRLFDGILETCSGAQDCKPSARPTTTASSGGVLPGQRRR